MDPLQGAPPEGDIEGQVLTHQRKGRYAWLAFLLGILAQGLGQLYAGKPMRAGVALVAFSVLILPSVMFAPLVLCWSPLVTIMGYLLTLILLLIIPLDGAIAARQNRHRARIWCNKAWVYLGYLVLFVALSLAESRWLSSLLWLHEFRIPTGAMIPTLLIGDQVIVEMSADTGGSVSRGDIVVFEAPGEPATLWVKRIVGLPGEVLEIRNKTVSINGEALHEPYKIHETELDPEAWSRVRGGEITRDSLLTEPGRQASPIFGELSNFGPYTVPASSYFLLGDNRDNSRDSRAFGAVPASSLRGRVLRIHWSRNPDTKHVRWKRLGATVN